METAFAPPLGIVVTAVALGGLLAAILPTCVYLYVEPRARLSWGVSGDTRTARRAPAIVRSTAWLSFAIAQFSVPWLLVPGACAVLLYLQAKLGVGRVTGPALTIAVGAMAVVQFALAVRLFPLGVRLLARDARLGPRLRGLARTIASVNTLLLALGAFMSWTMASLPGFVHPWLRVALAWSALRPVMAYAGIGLLHALMLRACGGVLTDSSRPPR
jgi:hypothetical protein